jgi:membrane protein
MSAVRVPEPGPYDEIATTPGERVWALVGPSLRYVFTVESHAYAFAIAANALLSFCPFLVLMLSLTDRVLRWPAASQVVLVALRDVLPDDPGLVDFVERNLRVAVASRGHTQAVSLVLLLLASNGIFVPLEVALNRLWRFTKDRSYWVNQALSFGFALTAGLLVFSATLLASLVAERAGRLWGELPWVVSAVTLAAVKLAVLPATIVILVVVYWLLPNGPIRLRRVFPTAIWTAIVIELAKQVYRLVWPWLDFRRAYGPFFVSISVLLWGYLTAMIILAGAELSTRWPAERPGPRWSR